MPRKPMYAIGDELSPSEVATAKSTILPNVKRNAKLNKPAAFLKAMVAFAPARLEHEVNRKRGYAFDSGEAGFSHTTGGTP